MLFLIDECIPNKNIVTTFLETQGHNAVVITPGTLDVDVHVEAQNMDAAIMTLDKGFMDSTVKTPGRKPVFIFKLTGAKQNQNIKNARPFVAEALRRIDQYESIHVISSRKGALHTSTYEMKVC